MHRFKSILRFLLAVTVMPAVLLLEGCGTKITYSYDLHMNFPDLKSYKWDCAAECLGDAKTKCTPALTRKDPVVESNVRFFADEMLKEKGFHKSCEKPDFLISINYDCETLSLQHSYHLRMLALIISRVEKEMPTVWQGTASGTIYTDADSDSLKMAVRDILSKFPPKSK